MERPDAIRRFVAMTHLAMRNYAATDEDLAEEDDRTREALRLLGATEVEIEAAFADMEIVRTDVP